MTEYGPTLPISKEIHAMKYRGEGETFKEAMSRVADALKDNEEHFNEFRSILYTQRFLPAGRIQSSIGSPRSTTPYNCYVSGVIGDSMADIMDKAAEAAETMRLGGGIGYDFSTLRPRGALIRSLDSRSSGPLAFMDVFDALCGCISSAGHRRGAQMGVLRVDHPDIEEFVTAKANHNKLTNFNISVGITDEFMEAVKKDRPFNLVFEGRVYKTIRATYLWDKILRCTWDWAEPGVLFIDRINKKNNLHYTETIAATNPCVHPDTPILTRNGYLNIEELAEEGNLVDVWNGEEFSSVLVRKTGENQPMKTVNFSDGSSLTCTHYHKFYLKDGSEVEAKNLKIGDKLLKSEWPVCEPTDYFDEVYTDLDEAYERGFFSGDGWVKGEDKVYIGLYGEKKKLLPNFKNYLSCYEYNIGGGYEGTDKKETKLYLYYGKKFWKKAFIPDVNWTAAAKKAWLRGLMDSDGHVTKDGSAQISSKDRLFLGWVKLMLNELGAAGTLSEMKDCWRLSIPASYYYDLNIGCRHGRVKPNRSATRFIYVVSVEEDEVCEKVYCFTEPKRGMGVFGGILTGQCGEQPLPPYGACLLGSFNLAKYIYKFYRDDMVDSGFEQHYEFDWEQFKHDIPHVVRAMDNVIDIAVYPLEEQKREAQSKRRMGLGVTGLANAGEALGYPYGSEGFLEFTAKVLETLRDTAYRSSISLAIEKGPFPAFDPNKYGGTFFDTLPEDIKKMVREYGIRNSHLLSIAPTGTISLSADNVSSGIEPVFSHSYTRTIIGFDGAKTEKVEDYGLKVFGVKGVTADELDVMDHVNVLNLASYYVDSACSKTCNVGEKVSWDTFKQVYMSAYDGGASGCTTFRAAGKRFGILNASKDEEVVEGTACFIDPDTGKRTCE